LAVVPRWRRGFADHRHRRRVPESQYLHPEFVLFRRLFEQAGLTALICDPAELVFRDGALWHGRTRIDMVYNRLTDFALDAPNSSALRAAHLADAVVLTPHPRAHALYADKRNLVALSDDSLLASWGVDSALRTVLGAGIPRTELTTAEHADDLWTRRRQLFFQAGRRLWRQGRLSWRQDHQAGFEEVLAGITLPRRWCRRLRACWPRKEQPSNSSWTCAITFTLGISS